MDGKPTTMLCCSHCAAPLPRSILQPVFPLDKGVGAEQGASGSGYACIPGCRVVRVFPAWGCHHGGAGLRDTAATHVYASEDRSRAVITLR